MQWLAAILIVPYLILLSEICRSLLKLKQYSVASEPQIFVSILVACRNEEKQLPNLLKNLSEQDYPHELYEIIVIDDNSDDKTYEVASSFKSKCTIHTINNEGKGKKQALATGINTAIGSLIITTDADCQMGKRWLGTISSFYSKLLPDMIICPVKLEPKQDFFSGFQELEFLSLQGITAGSANLGKGTMCNGANLAFTRNAYLKNSRNLNSEVASGDDVFLLHSLKKDPSSKIMWLESPDSLVSTAPSHTLISFFNQRKRWISKSSSYTDVYTILLGIVTFVTILLQLSLMLAGIFNTIFFPVFITVFTLKSIPDFIILMNTSSRYGRRNLMYWFLPAQIIYPLYVFGVVLYSIISPEKGGISSPFRKET